MKGSTNKLTQASIKITKPMEGVRFKYFNPSLNSLITFLVCGCGIYFGNLINNKDTMTAIKLKALIRKQVPAPNFSNTMPEMAGPINRAKFTIDELSAMALGKSSLLSIISLTIDCLAGTSKALMVPSRTLNANISATVYRVNITNPVSSVAWISEATC